jgi:predicted acylesterase/phospholipase RssA
MAVNVPGRALLALILLLTAACGATLPFDQVPAERVDAAVVAGFEDVREAPFTGYDSLIADYRLSFAQAARANPKLRGGKLDLASLYISGGADYGAYGAGVLNGWSEAGDRPEFKVVTGVSTGALTAPLAFLGPSRDEELKQVFTTIGAGDIFLKSILRGVFAGDALADTGPLSRIIARIADEALIDEVAREHRKGRRLYILTTDIGAQQPWVWNLGAIAASDRPDRVDLFRRVLLASSAIPGLFPPVAFDVTVPEGPYQELHVDGGVTAQIFGLNGFPPMRRQAALAHRISPADVTHTVYTIRNGVIAPQPAPVRRNPAGILFASYKILAKADTLKDLALIMEEAANNGDAFRMHAIPEDFDASDYSPFNREIMRNLFELGRNATRNGDTWLRSAALALGPRTQVAAAARADTD